MYGVASATARSPATVGAAYNAQTCSHGSCQTSSASSTRSASQSVTCPGSSGSGYAVRLDEGDHPGRLGPPDRHLERLVRERPLGGVVGVEGAYGAGQPR